MTKQIHQRLTALIVFALGTNAVAQEADQASRLVAERLKPAEAAVELSWPGRRGPHPHQLPAALQPVFPLAKFDGAAPRAEFIPAARIVRPSALSAEPPLAEGGDPERPTPVVFHAGPLLRIPQVDSEQPTPLPALAKIKVERAALADPTVAASVQAALAQAIPMRALPEPFTPLNLPRPFEHREAVRLRQPPAEEVPNY